VTNTARLGSRQCHGPAHLASSAKASVPLGEALGGGVRYPRRGPGTSIRPPPIHRPAAITGAFHGACSHSHNYAMHPEQVGQPSLNEAEFDELYRRLKATAIWGASDRRGALNYITSVQVQAAVREVRSGRTVTLAAPIETEPSHDNPEPSEHHMTGPADSRPPAAGLEVVRLVGCVAAENGSRAELPRGEGLAIAGAGDVDLPAGPHGQPVDFGPGGPKRHRGRPSGVG
jgi:hypothetical protein